MESHKLKIKILEIYKECNIRDFPIDCFSILNHYGFRILTYADLMQRSLELKLLCQSFSDDAFTDKNSGIIAYNSKRNSGRIYFSLMHELGHIILDHKGNCQNNEDEADYFASNILAPRVAISAKKCTTADEIHKYFGLSYAASNRTLCEYKKWLSQEQSDAEKELSIWLFSPNYYQHRERFFKNLDSERRKLKKKTNFYDERQRWLGENLDNYNENIWQLHEQILYE